MGTRCGVLLCYKIYKIDRQAIYDCVLNSAWTLGTGECLKDCGAYVVACADLRSSIGLREHR